MYPLMYEFFIRHAFDVERGEDPAGLAEASLIQSEENLHLIKAASAYAACIHRNNLVNDSNLASDLAEAMQDDLDDAIKNTDCIVIL